MWPQANLRTDRGDLPSDPPMAMAAANDPVEALLGSFQPISLEELDETAKLLKRIDNKYLIHAETLPAILEMLSEHYRILEIDDTKVFSYRSCYFDDAFNMYHEHHRGIRNRVKVRRRQYIEADKVYFEVKLKGKRNSTNKIRVRCQDDLESALSEENRAILEAFYRETYNKAFPYDLNPSLIVGFKRISLASIHGGERVTIDFDLHFESGDGETYGLGEQFVIVETKSDKGRGQSDKILKANGIRRAKRCSKYCLGAILSGSVKKYNNFRPIMRLIRDRAAGSALSPAE